VVPAAIVLAAPAATPEKITPDGGDFPYLMPVPGSHATGSRADASPVYVQLPDAHQPELVANGSIIKTYHAPKCLSAAALLSLYRDALPKAGWTLVSDVRQGNSALTAHYGQNNRNIWASVRANDSDYALAVADATVTPTTLAADLSARCHLALTGVLFDFDKSTLKPESDAVLTQVGLMMAADPGLRLDVQGHTDNVGTDAYNQRLSEARAASVVAWLTQHQVAAARLTAYGFGKTRPLASNDTDEERARNRRVEVANPSCTRN
jgi:OmpA-OmpF porin, OOP family